MAVVERKGAQRAMIILSSPLPLEEVAGVERKGAQRGMTIDPISYAR